MSYPSKNFRVPNLEKDVFEGEDININHKIDGLIDRTIPGYTVRTNVDSNRRSCLGVTVLTHQGLPVGRLKSESKEEVFRGSQIVTAKLRYTGTSRVLTNEL